MWEFCAIGNLSDVILDRSKNLPPALKLKIAKQVSNGMLFLHQNHILHRDLKPENVLLAAEGVGFTCRIGDFGTSKQDDGAMNGTKTGDIGSPVYMAPEIMMEPTAKYGNSIDVYSFGMLLWAMCARAKPYADQNVILLRLCVKIHQGFRPTIPKTMSKELRRLIESCWAVDPNARPSFQQVMVKLNQKNAVTMFEPHSTEASIAEEEEANSGLQSCSVSSSMPKLSRRDKSLTASLRSTLSSDSRYDSYLTDSKNSAKSVGRGGTFSSA